VSILASGRPFVSGDWNLSAWSHYIMDPAATLTEELSQSALMGWGYQVLGAKKWRL
jgi:hypothetical protein